MRWSYILVTVLGAACGGPPAAQLSHTTGDVFGAMAGSAAASPCAVPPPPSAPPVPSASRDIVDAARYDVAFYLAHPEDETLFAPGTIDALVRAKARVFHVVMSHGEGGRLVKRDANGKVTERTGEAPARVAEVRDEELARAMKMLGIAYEHLYPATANTDFAAEDVQGHGRAVHGCTETFERWDHLVPGGVAGILKAVVTSIRTRRPRVIVTHDPRDDDDWLDHGHHKALGALVDIAARAAADWHVPGGSPHVVEELVTIAPKQVPADLTLEVGSGMRKKLMTANTSQFEPQKLFEIAQRSSERFVVQWRATGAVLPPSGSLLSALAKIDVKRSGEPDQR